MGLQLIKSAFSRWGCLAFVLALLIITPRITAIEAAEGLIAFTSDRGGNIDIYTMLPDGSNVRRITSGTGGKYNPTWSPDGTQIAYIQRTAGRSDLYVMNANGSRARLVSDDEQAKIDITWSPDGTRIGFTTLEDGVEGFTIVTLESGETRTISDIRLVASASWSPDGTQILYVRSSEDQAFDIFAYDLEDEEEIQLTDDEINQTYPEWSPDGTQILFISQARDAEGKSFSNLYTLLADGSDQQLLLEDARRAVWSPDGSEIAFLLSQEGGGANIYLMDADGRNVRQITTEGDVVGAFSWQPVLEDTPDDEQTDNTEPPASSGTSRTEGLIAFTGDVDFTFEIFTVRPDGSELQRITDNDLLETSVAWSPDGTQIVFEGREDSEDAYDLYVIDADGTNLRQLTDTRNDNEEFPAWSPDGSQIVFESDERGNSHIYVMDADGSNIEQLTRGTSYNQMASWTPDGSQILFTSDREGPYNVYLMNPDGSDVTPLTDDIRSSFYPRLSPDGTQIVYARAAGEQYALYVMDADGRNRQRLYSDDNLQVFPNWSPDSSKIVFTSVSDEEAHLYVIDRDGENLRLLVDDPEFALYASWTGGGEAPIVEQTPVAPDVVFQDTGCRAIIKDNLNLRETPETGRVILTLPVGTEVVVTNRNENNAWWKILYNDEAGWVAKRFTESKGTCTNLPLEGEEVEVQPTSQPATATPTEAADNTCRLFSDLVLSVREAPVSGDPISLISVGEDAVVIARLPDNSWYKVRYGNQEGWVRALRVDTVGDCESVPVEDVPLPTAAPTATPAPSNTNTCQISGNVVLNLRETPVSGDVLSIIDIGDEAQVIARLADSAWYKVSYRGDEGWVSALLVEISGDCDSVPVEDLPTAVPTATSASTNANTCQISGNVVLNVRATPVDGDVVTVILIGEQADVIARLADSSWYKVSYRGDEGWVSALLVEMHGNCDSLPIEEASSLPAETPATQVLSPAGDLIVFSSSREGLFYLFVIKPDGTGLRRIAESESGALTPAWSPDGTRIAFSRNLFGNTDIYVVNADGTNIQRVTRDPGIDTSPTWSPDGRQIAYTSVSGDFRSVIAVTGVNGRLSKQVSDTGNDFDQYPAWSPDGTQIAFISGGRNEGDIYVMDTDGDNLTRLTFERRILTPAWSPDGTQIAFALTRSGNMDIYTMDADGDNIRRVTTESSADFGPSWSPDGSEIVYVSSSLFENNNIYVVEVASGESRRLTEDSGDDLYPSWNPNPNPDADIPDPAATPTPAATETQAPDTPQTFTDEAGQFTFDYLSGSALDGSDAEITLTQGSNLIMVYAHSDMTPTEAVSTPAPAQTLTRTATDGTGQLTFDYLSGVMFDEDIGQISLIRERDSITIYKPSFYASVVGDEFFVTPAAALKFFAEERGFTLAGDPTEKTPFGKALAQVSLEPRGNQGTAFLVDVGDGNRAVVLWLTPEDKTLSAPMVQTLVKIMSSITYTEGSTSAIPATATPTVVATVPSLPTSTALPTASPTSASEQGGTVMDAVLSDPELSTFATSIIAAGLLDELTSANGFQYTVFAPTNAAFDAMLSDMEMTKTEFLSDPALLTTILSYHLLPGKLTSDALQTGTVTTLSGAALTLSVSNSQVVVNDVSTVGPFVETGNGVVYVIDGVLIPPALR